MNPARLRGLALGTLLAAAFALRLAVAARLPILEVDGAYWCGLARAFARTDWSHALNSAWPPLYPALVALAARAGGGGDAALAPAALEWSARLVSVIAGTLLLLPLRSLSRRLLPEPGTWAVLLVAAAHPRLVEYSAAGLSESVYTLALVTGVAALARAAGPAPADDSGGSGWPLLGGVCFGFAFLARPEALPLGLGIVLGSWILRRFTGRPVRPDFVLALLIVSLPWLVFLHHRTGGWTLGEKGTYNFWRAHREAHARHFAPPVSLPRRVNWSPEISPAPVPGEVRPLALLRMEPAAVLGRTARQLGTLVAATYPVTVGWPLAALVLVGLVMPRAGPWWVAWLPLALAPLLVAPFSADRRFLVPMVPLLLPFAIVPLEAVGRRSRAWATPVLAGAVAAGLALYAWGIPARADRAPELRAAGESLGRDWAAGAIRSRAIPAAEAGAAPARPPVVMARKPWVAFYGGFLIADLPDAPPDSILAEARKSGVTFLVADRRAAESDRPQLRPWLEASGPPGWTPVVTPDPERVRIFAR